MLVVCSWDDSIGGVQDGWINAIVGHEADHHLLARAHLELVEVFLESGVVFRTDW